MDYTPLTLGHSGTEMVMMVVHSRDNYAFDFDQFRCMCSTRRKQGWPLPSPPPPRSLAVAHSRMVCIEVYKPFGHGGSVIVSITNQNVLLSFSSRSIFVFVLQNRRISTDDYDEDDDDDIWLCIICVQIDRAFSSLNFYCFRCG